VRDVLLLDLDGVLRRWPPVDAAAEDAAGLPRGCLHAAAFDPAVLEPAVTGRITDEEWRRSVGDVLAAEYGAAAADRALEVWSATPGELDADVLAILDDLRPDVRVVLATNATTRLRHDLARLGLADRFAAIASSAEIGAAKPASAFFDAALALVGAEPAQALYVDDTAANIEAADALGIDALLFSDPAVLRDWLRGHGALASP
jgi:putative hydrolase of the HAD superfamily